MSQYTANLSVQGAWEVKRHFNLPTMTHDRDARTVTDRIGRLTGVRGTRADVRRHRVTVVYDTTRLYYRQVLDALAETGYPVPETWWSRLKTSWLQNLDETGRGNANRPEAPCCSNPKGIAPTKRH
jgi:copper chaperone CopZ